MKMPSDSESEKDDPADTEDLALALNEFDAEEVGSGDDGSNHEPAGGGKLNSKLGLSSDDGPKTKIKTIHAAEKVGKARKAQKAHTAQNTGRPKNVIGKTKQCAGCQKHFPNEEFPPSSKFCAQDKQAVQNFNNAVKKQNMVEWWEKVQANPKKFKRILFLYNKKHPMQVGRKRPAPRCVQFEEQHRMELQVLADGVWEMLCVDGYIHEMGKPKHGSIKPLVAREDFWKKHREPDSIVDEDGPTTELKERLATKTKDLITHRDADIQSKVLTVRDREQKKASEEDINKAVHKMRSTGFAVAGAVPNGHQGGMDMITGKAMLVEGGGESSAFLSVARGLKHLGDLKEYCEDDDDGDADEEDEDEDQNGKLASEVGSGGSATGAIANGTPKAKGASKGGGVDGAPWFDRGLAIGQALTAHENWRKAQGESLGKLVAEIKTTLDVVNSMQEVAPRVENEKKLV